MNDIFFNLLYFVKYKMSWTIMNLRLRGITNFWLDEEPLKKKSFQIYLAGESLHFWQFFWFTKMAKEIIALQKPKDSWILPAPPYF